MDFKLSIARLESENPYSLNQLRAEWDRFAGRYIELGKLLDENYKKRNNNRKAAMGDKTVKFCKKAQEFNYQDAHAEHLELGSYLRSIRIHTSNNYNRLWLEFPK